MILTWHLSGGHNSVSTLLVCHPRIHFCQNMKQMVAIPILSYGLDQHLLKDKIKKVKQTHWPCPIFTATNRFKCGQF